MPQHTPVRRRDWERIGAVAGVVGVVIALVAILVSHSDASSGDTTGTQQPAVQGQNPVQDEDTSPGTERTTSGQDLLDALDLPRAYVGTWRGMVKQGDQKYLAVLRLTAGSAGESVGGSEYPTLECTGELQLISGGDDVVVKEDVDSTGCVDVEIRLALRDDGTLDYRVEGNGFLVEACHGVLAREREK
ncbi:hypothetical protein KIH74_30010 [Kineosporia sp. J2-2]|uniref:Lipoprotein n=1 Tax=Kineosporia corallincola TaxID=2835133 RepID=A0ABS5TQ64_9ACTN|nr:hypothetical protein [Kineosporia corallincola]MBT0773217.1 hypothetical protein [Kineosporia corallincola]